MQSSIGPEDSSSRDAVTFEILEHLGVLRASAAGWTRELNIVSWCSRPAKYDIREWSPDHAKMGKGITLSDEEVAILKKALDSRNL